MGEAIRMLDESTVEPALRRFAQEAAFVERADPLHVRSRAGTWMASRAASCLVAPDVGDKVLIARSDDGEEVYVLAILTRNEAQPTAIAVDGELHIAAREGIRLSTAGDIETTGRTMTVHVEEAKLFVQSMAYLGREIVSQVNVAKVMGTRLDGVWQSVRQHAKRVYRTATEGEYVRAGSVDVRADNQLSLHGDNAAVTAKKLVKMDAGQIVMG